MSARQCIDDGTACHIACVETAMHCLAQGGVHAERDRVRPPKSEQPASPFLSGDWMTSTKGREAPTRAPGQLPNEMAVPAAGTVAFRDRPNSAR